MNRNIYISTYEDDTLLFKETTKGRLEEDDLEFNTDNDKILINLNRFSFTKENVESILKLSKEKCTLTLKEIKQSLDIPIDYIYFKSDNNKNIEIKYKLISQEKPLKMIIEIGDEYDEI